MKKKKLSGSLVHGIVLLHLLCSHLTMNLVKNKSKVKQTLNKLSDLELLTGGLRFAKSIDLQRFVDTSAYHIH